ncbi:ATP-binding protein [Streptomyces sp. NPDC004647]|uniref:ATP-binding protein n=1 Tax=Streptomyces sp. NPDC004647 TaxID=3154671 RepID=UPI0033A00DCB
MNRQTPASLPTGQRPLDERSFAMQFTSTPRGARLARRLVSHRLHAWGHPYASDTNHTLTLIAAELVANAVRHGHVPGRDFLLRLAMTASVLRIEVSDTRTERVVPPTAPAVPSPDAESGRGLLLVSQLATVWAVTARKGAPGKTVWAEIALV